LVLAVKIYTIGFTKKSAERFFELLQAHGIGRLIDIRLKPGGQLAGFAKQDDLAYFLRELAGCEYHHLEFLAPSEDILTTYRRDKDWPRYERRFEALMDERDVVSRLEPAFFAEKACCLLCSEDTPEQCHRRLVVERLARSWPDVEIVHLT
jgi:uncharacterized protein (DUF488 family)